MRRQDIQLLALARQGDVAARCEAGRRYLRGTDGFPQHIGTGLEYLTHPNLKGSVQAARIIRVNFQEGLRNMLFQFIHLTGFAHRVPLIADAAGIEH